MKIVEDIELDDSELHRRAEEHIKEINEKNRRMAQEIYDTVMEYRRNKRPELNFIDKTEEFKKESDFNPRMFSLKRALKSLSDEKICKVQGLSDLTKIKDMFGTIGDGKHSYWNLGSKCYLFCEDGEVKIKTMEDWISTRKFETMFGTVICQNRGEWGGCLYVLDENEVLAINSSSYSFDGVHEHDGRVFVCERSVHMGGSCSLHEIAIEDGRLVLKTIFESEDLNFAGYCFDENYLYFYSKHWTDGLYRLNLDSNELERIHWVLCSKVDVSDLLKKDNYIYIYGKYNLIKYNLNTGTHEVFTNLEYGEITDEMYADGKKLFDLWEELIER